MRKRRYLIPFVLAWACPFFSAMAQQGYEFEVYDTHLTKPGTTELELNTNFAAEKEFSSRWEFAASFGRGLTASSDRSVIATRVEYLIGH